MITLDQLLGSVPLGELDAFELMLREYTNNRPAFIEKLKSTYSPAGPHPPNAESLWNAGWVNDTTLMMSLIKYAPAANGVKEVIFRMVLDHAEKANIISRSSLSPSVSLQLNATRIAELDLRGLLRVALVNRPDYVISTSSRSVFAIEVEKGGNQHVGTGFVAAVQSADKNVRCVMVTVAHNISQDEGAKVVSITLEGGVSIPSGDCQWRFHDSIDIAACWLPESLQAPPLWPALIYPALSETISLGYPRVPSTTDRYMLAHRGEINAIVRSYLTPGEHLIISNAVSPGNSGSPVLLRSGLFAGIVVKAFEGEHEGGKYAMQAALTASEIVAFLDALPE